MTWAPFANNPQTQQSKSPYWHTEKFKIQLHADIPTKTTRQLDYSSKEIQNEPPAANTTDISKHNISAAAPSTPDQQQTIQSEISTTQKETAIQPHRSALEFKDLQCMSRLPLHYPWRIQVWQNQNVQMMGVETQFFQSGGFPYLQKWRQQRWQQQNDWTGSYRQLSGSFSSFNFSRTPISSLIFSPTIALLTLTVTNSSPREPLILLCNARGAYSSSTYAKPGETTIKKNQAKRKIVLPFLQ